MDNLDPSRRYDDIERPDDHSETEKEFDDLHARARSVMAEGINKYHTLRAIQEAQADLAPILVKHPDLRPTIESAMDRRALEIIQNQLLTVPNQTEFRKLVNVVDSFEFYDPAKKREAVELLIRSNEGISHI